jgi:hypothetical protein
MEKLKSVMIRKKYFTMIQFENSNILLNEEIYNLHRSGILQPFPTVLMSA